MPETKDVIELLERRITKLHGDAELLVSNYWNEVLRLEKEHPGADKRNKLRLRCKKIGNSIRAEWIGISWVGKTKRGGMFEKKDHITKQANSFGYTLSKLYKYAHEWEKQLVNETEHELAKIRHEAHHLTRAMISLNHAMSIEVKHIAESGSHE